MNVLLALAPIEDRYTDLIIHAAQRIEGLTITPVDDANMAVELLYGGGFDHVIAGSFDLIGWLPIYKAAKEIGRDLGVSILTSDPDKIMQIAKEQGLEVDDKSLSILDKMKFAPSSFFEGLRPSGEKR